MLESLNRYVGAILSGLTIMMVANGIVMYGFTQRIDERVQALEEYQEQQIQINRSISELAQTVAVIQDRQDRENGG